MLPPAPDTPGPRPKVSAIMVTCNRLTNLRGCARMILDQTHSDLELIVADDHSGDGTEAWVRRLIEDDPRVRYNRAPFKGGINTALNSAIAGARGEYIQICHDHDHYLPGLTARMAGVLDRHPGVVFVHPGRQGCDHLMNPRPDCLFVCGYPEVTRGDQWRRFMLGRLDSPVTGLSMIRRSALDQAGLFDAEFGPCSDVDMWLRLCALGDVGYVDELLLYVRGREPGHPYEGAAWQVGHQLIRIHRKHLKLAYSGPGYVYRRARSEFEIDLSLAVSYLNSFRHKRSRDIAEGRQYLRRHGVLVSRLLGWAL
jgi:glycosyltransferase involved in cell wall biosynthesis